MTITDKIREFTGQKQILRCPKCGHTTFPRKLEISTKRRCSKCHSYNIKLEWAGQGTPLDIKPKIAPRIRCPLCGMLAYPDWFNRENKIESTIMTVGGEKGFEYSSPESFPTVEKEMGLKMIRKGLDSGIEPLSVFKLLMKRGLTENDIFYELDVEVQESPYTIGQRIAIPKHRIRPERPIVSTIRNVKPANKICNVNPFKENEKEILEKLKRGKI